MPDPLIHRRTYGPPSAHERWERADCRLGDMQPNTEEPTVPRKPRKTDAAAQALSELRLRRAECHQAGCSCQTKTPISPGRLAGACGELRRAVLDAGQYAEIQ